MKRTTISTFLILTLASSFAQIKVYSGGKTAIGGTSFTPVYPLSLLGGSTNALIIGQTLRNNNTANSGSAIGLGFSVNDVEMAKSGFIFERTTSWGLGKLHLVVNNSYDNTTPISISDAKMTLQNDGNTGIGTTTPKNKLDVNGGLAVGTYAGVNAGPSNGIIISGSVGIGTTTAGYKLTLNAGNSGTQPFYSTYTPQGDYQYGMQSDANCGSYIHAKLFIGTKTISGTTTEVFTVEANGDAFAGNWYQTSDKNLKTNINNLSNSLARVLKLQGVNYNYKDLGEPNQLYMGLIAQEVEKVVPEVVKTNNNGIKSISYPNLTALLIEALKEQNTRIDSIITINKSLQTLINNCCNSKPQGMKLNNNGGINTPNQPSGNNALEQTSRIESMNIPKLFQNNPNPFNQSTSIEYYLPIETTKSASMLIFDMQGKLIKTIVVSNFGHSALTINANELNAGMYIYSLVADGYEIDNKRMLLTQ